MDILIIIPTQLANTQMLECTLLSLLANNQRINFAITLVVNNTERQFIKFQKQSKPEIFDKLVIDSMILDRNYGFAYAVNQALKQKKYKNYVLLNDDIIVSPNFVEHLVKMQYKSQCDMVASKIYKADQDFFHRYNQSLSQARKKEIVKAQLSQSLIDSCGFTYLFRGRALPLDQNQNLIQHSLHVIKDLQNLEETRDYWMNYPDYFSNDDDDFFKEPFGPDGAACLYTRKLFESVGFFDDKFFAYLEDVDLALRARRAGLSCALAKNAIAFHHKHATSRKMAGFKEKQDVINWWRIVLRDYRWRVWRSFWFKILLERTRNLKAYLIG